MKYLRILRDWLHRHSERVVSSIAFWPSLLGVAFVLLAMGMRSFSTKALFTAVDETMPFLLIRDRNVSLSLLTTLISGLISLMVFSFSMVMVLLSNATANLSPRLLPSLIGSRRHQVVLGVYLGTIFYCIIIAMGFGLDAEGGRPPSTSVALAVLFGILCLALFIYFIHGVSRSIQVGVVLKDAHAKTRKSLEQLLARQADQSDALVMPDLSGWSPIYAWKAGSYRGLSGFQLAAFAKTQDTQLAAPFRPGTYVVPGDLLLMSQVPLLPDVLEQDSFRSHVYFNPDADTDDYYGYGVEHMTDVALKALSPGINDPGTAVVAINYLRQIFHEAADLREVLATADAEGIPRIYELVEAWPGFLGQQLEAIQAYGSEDPMTQRALAKMRDSLLRKLHAERPELVEEVAAHFQDVKPPKSYRSPNSVV